MTTANLFELVELKQDVPNNPMKAGHKGIAQRSHSHIPKIAIPTGC
jgi:hypothetical protein